MDAPEYLHLLTLARIRGQMDEQQKIMSEIQKQREDEFLTDLAIFAKRVGIDETLRILSDVFMDAASDEKFNEGITDAWIEFDNSRKLLDAARAAWPRFQRHSERKVECCCYVCQQEEKK